MANNPIDAVANTRAPVCRPSDVYLRAQPRARYRVLVVDDEPLIRLFVARALQASDYDVIQADSAERASELLASEGHTLSLLLSDVGLPGASGAELVEHARRLFPNLRSQLMSATPKHWLVRERVLPPDVDVLQKPFTMADLLSRLDQLLAA